MSKKLYMAVTKDEYELPYAVEDSSEKLARKIGMNVKTLRSCISHGYRGYCRVEIDDEEEAG